MNEKKTLIAIRKVLAQWNLSCAEESCLKKQLADELLLAVKNCNTTAVSKSDWVAGEPTVCEFRDICRHIAENGNCNARCRYFKQ